MALYETLEVNKLRVGRLEFTNQSAYYPITNLTQLPGENGTTALSEQVTVGRFNTYSNYIFTGATVNAAPFRLIASALDHKQLLTGTTVGNMATTDRITLMTVAKGGLANYIIVKAGTTTGTAGASSITVSDPLIESTDFAFGQVRATGTGARTADKMVCTTDTLTITMSGAMTASHTVDYVIVRAVGLGIESHRIALIGSAALDAVGAGVSDTLTVTGVAAGDILLMQPIAQTETDHYLIGSVPTTNTITCTFSGAPGVTTLGYAVIRKVL